MPSNTIRRKTSKDVAITFQPVIHPRSVYTAACVYPVLGTAQDHIVNVTVPASITAGSYYVRVNGYRSAAILFSSNAAAVETLVEAITGVGAGNLTVSGTLPDLVFTATGDLQDKFLHIEIEGGELTGGTVTLEVAQAGSEVILISSETSSFSYVTTSDTVDMTAINEEARIEMTTVSDGTFSLSVYEALQEWRHMIIDGMEGYLTVYETGIGTGKRYFVWDALFTETSVSLEQFEKIEIEISGRRNGLDIIPVGSYQP